MRSPIMGTASNDPHAGGPVFSAGVDLARAKAAVILLHGRGGDPRSILQLAKAIGAPDVAYCAPEARDHSWYPDRFLAPASANEPWLSSALGVIQSQIEAIMAAGLPRDRIVLGGFSQGACLSLEAALRFGGRLGGVLALSGAVIGDPNAPRPLDRSLERTPVLVACGDVDAHIPVLSVRQSAQVLREHDADVTERIYPGLGHIIVSDEIDHIRRMLASLGQRN